MNMGDDWTDDFDAPEAAAVTARAYEQVSAAVTAVAHSTASAMPADAETEWTYSVDGRIVTQSQFEAAMRDGKRHKLVAWGEPWKTP